MRSSDSCSAQMKAHQLGSRILREGQRKFDRFDVSCSDDYKEAAPEIATRLPCTPLASQCQPSQIMGAHCGALEDLLSDVFPIWLIAVVVVDRCAEPCICHIRPIVFIKAGRIFEPCLVDI
jgi:hypothetical protein